MSGHSHWATIKHKKGVADMKRGQMFSKLIKIVEVAAKKDPNPDTNPALRVAIERAKKINIPSDKIDYAIKKAQGLTKDASVIEEGVIEAIGPEASSLIIEIITDNRNRTVAELRNILNKYGGRVAEPGSCLWNFEKKAIIETAQKITEDQSLKLIDDGAEDFIEQNGAHIIKTEPKQLQTILNDLKGADIEVKSFAISYVPKSQVNLQDPKIIESAKRLLEELDDCEDVNTVYTNLKF